MKNPQLDRTRALIIVIAVALLVHAPSIFNMFAYDDVAVISRDVRIHSLANLPEILTTSYWNDDSQALYRPLVTASFAVDWAVATNHPGWYHFMNILWNAAACALVLLVLARLFPVAAAMAGALVFAVHPVHVEAVANVVGRAELMAAAFAMGAAYLWMRSRDRRDVLVLAPALFGLALLSKESAVMLAPLLVLLDVTTGRLQWRARDAYLRERMPGLAMIALVAVAYIGLRAIVLDSIAPSTLDPSIEVAPDGLPRVLTALQIWPTWLRLFFYPVTLLADYGPRIIMPAWSVTPKVAAGLVILVTLVAGGIAALVKGWNRTALALLWVPIATLPVSNLLFPIGILVAERTLYLPLFSLSIAVAAAFVWLEPRSVRAAWYSVVVVVALLSVRTIVRIPDWRDTSSIFRALMRDRPDSFRAHWHLARTGALYRKRDAALVAYSRALNLWPYRRRLLKEATHYATVSGDVRLARSIAEQGTRVWPLDPDFPRNLAALALDAGDTAAAGVHIRKGLSLAPADSILLRMQQELNRRGGR